MSRYDPNRGKKSNRTAFFVIAILLALVIGRAGTYFLVEKPETAINAITTLEEKAPTHDINIAELQKPPLTRSEQLPKPATPPSPPTASPSAPTSDSNAALPDLLGSDEPFRQAVVKLSPDLLEWLNTDQLIRKFMVIVNDFAQGQRLTKHMGFFRLDEGFAVNQDGTDFSISPKSYQRYNKLVSAFQAIDPKAAAALYKQYRPLIMQVYEEFGYPPDITLEMTVNKAVAEVLAVPVIEEEIAVVRPSVFYKFADPKLEGLNDVQKQLVRMGPDNTRTIQAKCREFLAEFAKIDVGETGKAIVEAKETLENKAKETKGLDNAKAENKDVNSAKQEAETPKPEGNVSQ